jgi:hypothetical protein
MTTSYAIKPGIDVPEWFPEANLLNAHAAGGCLAYDQRNGLDRHPLIYQYASAAILNAYNPITDEWSFIGNPAMGTFGAGCGATFVASAGPNGTIAAGASSSSVTLSTALPAAVGINQMCNRGDGVPFKVRITDTTAGKTEDAYVIGNSAGTTPVLTLSKTLGSQTNLSFTPATGATYQFLSGRVFLMATAAPMWKWYDILTNSFSAALTATNLTAPATDTWLGVLDELYTPVGEVPGMGFFGQNTAGGSAAGTLTGQTGGTDASLQANEYANFQIRIVADPTTPASVGQRRKIASHTAANPTVYTLSSNWTTNPSNAAVYVIEQIGDVIAFTGSAVALSHTYAAAGWRADGAWSTGVTNGGVAALQIPARQANTAAGITGCIAYGITPDSAKNARRSAIYMVRGGAIATMDCLDIAALSWTTGVGGAAIAYGNQGDTFTTGTCGCYDPNGTYKDASAMLGNAGVSEPGLYWYISLSGGQRFRRFDVKNRVLQPWAYYRQAQGAAAVGERMAMSWAYDSSGPTYGPMVNFMGCSLATMQRALAPN